MFTLKDTTARHLSTSVNEGRRRGGKGEEGKRGKGKDNCFLLFPF